MRHPGLQTNKRTVIDIRFANLAALHDKIALERLQDAPGRVAGSLLTVRYPANHPEEVSNAEPLKVRIATPMLRSGRFLAARSSLMSTSDP